MNWSKLKDEDGEIIQRVIVSDTMPAYKIARFTVAGSDSYRPSQSGQFIGAPQKTIKDARDVCERHKQIMG